MSQNKPQLIEDMERETDSLKTLGAVVFTVIMLVLFGILVQIASRITVVTF
jgi:hypothetical protein